MKDLSNGLTLLSSLLLMASITLSGCTSRQLELPVVHTIKSQHALNINTADKHSLEALPGIGAELAAKIIEHRTRYGPFRKPEHLLIVDGISERRFHDVENLITTD